MKRKQVSLALQGGGALGAYTWGALDRLLEEERIEISAISGSSAGAMCAVVLAEGLAERGAEGARKQLRQFWEGVARAGHANPYRRTPTMAGRSFRCAGRTLHGRSRRHVSRCARGRRSQAASLTFP